MKSVLITGGLGFVGSHLTDALLAEGSRVTIVDNCQTNAVEPGAYSSTCQVLVEKIETAQSKLTPAAGHKFDEIYHLASIVGPAGVLEYAGEIATSVIGSGDAAVALALQHGSRLIVASTSEVYGRSGHLSEDLDCIVSPEVTVRLEYAAAKLTSEIAVLNKAKVSELQVSVVRPFNISGPRQKPEGGFVLPRFIVAALKGEPLTVFGDGTQVRAFTDVRDIVSGLMAMMRAPRMSLVLNLGNQDNEISILSLAHQVKRLSQSSSEIAMVDPKELFGELYEEGIERVPNATLAFKELGWKPRYSLEQTILDTLQFYKDSVAAEERSFSTSSKLS